MAVQCPKCKTNVSGLVKKYDVINRETGKGQSIEIEKAVCEGCIVELFNQVLARRENEQV
jgi:hypothetical protein